MNASKKLLAILSSRNETFTTAETAHGILKHHRDQISSVLSDPRMNYLDAPMTLALILGSSEFKAVCGITDEEVDALLRISEKARPIIQKAAQHHEGMRTYTMMVRAAGGQ